MLKRMGRRYYTTMHAIRKWVNKPRKNDTRLLAQFYFADEELIRVTQELDSFDGRSDPDRCTQLIAELKLAQEKVIGLIEEIKNVISPGCGDSSREFRVKFPDEVLQDNLAGQLWFGAECLCAGSTIVNREQESIQLRPLAKQVVKSLAKLRAALREQALKNLNVYPSCIKDAIVAFDHVFAQFEFEYVSILSRVRSVDDHDKLLEISVLFCETVERAVDKNLLKQEMIEDYDPGLMITIPRLAIICGVLVFPDGPLDLSKGPDALPLMFKPFYKLLRKIRDLLFTLTDDELFILEKTLCSEENFDEVVLAADALLSSSTYEKSYKNQQRDRYNRPRRFGSFLPELLHLPSSTYEANLGMCETNIRDIGKKVSDDRNEESVENSAGSRIGVRNGTQNLTIITEVEVHNNSYNEDNARQSGSSSESTPTATLQNSQETMPRDSRRRSSVSPSDFTASQTRISLNGAVNPTGYMSHAPDYPPPPYSSGAEEDGYSSSGESSSHDSNRISNESVSNTMPDATGSAELTLNARGNIRSSDTWPSTASGVNAEVTLSNSAHEHSRSFPLNAIAQECLNVAGPAVGPVSADIQLAGFEAEVMISLLNSPDPEASNASQVVASESSTHHLNEQEEEKRPPSTVTAAAAAAAAAASQHESGSSSTSTLYLYKDSSSDTESEGLIPHKFHRLRSKFKSTRDLIHTLFVCISGVADQLQSNYPSDVRQTLKSVFLSMCSNGEKSLEQIQNDITKGWLTSKQYICLKQHEEPPPWIDDSECSCCSGCSTCFNFFKRRHHCRLCGKIFCSSCASNFVPLPRYGLLSPVRVCGACIETAIERLV